MVSVWPDNTVLPFGPNETQWTLVAAGIVRRLITAYAGESYPAGGVNPVFQHAIDSGEVEIDASEINLFNSANPLPFNIDEYQEVGEEVRLRYRYLDLRRPEMAKKFRMRHQITQYVHDFMNQHSFLEIETPMMTKTPGYLASSLARSGSV